MTDRGKFDNSGEQLRMQVYVYLREQLKSGLLEPGTSIKISEIAPRLGISRTPLRDALIRLETEGFVTILPQRGVIVNSFSYKDFQHITEMLGALESKIVRLVFPKIKAKEIAKFKRLNKKMKDLAESKGADYKNYIDCNLEFHDVFLDLSENQFILKQIRILKQRIYDFPDRDYGSKWQYLNVNEHEKFIQLIEMGDAKEAADYLRDVHWTSYPIMKSVIEKE